MHTMTLKKYQYLKASDNISTYYYRKMENTRYSSRKDQTQVVNLIFKDAVMQFSKLLSTLLSVTKVFWPFATEKKAAFVFSHLFIGTLTDPNQSGV